MTLESVPAPPPASSGAGDGSGWLDWLFAGIVCTLAFLLASTPSHNSDLWLHLASGRALVRGQAPPGTDPFASTTAGVYWVNHAWLSDAVLYALYEIGDGQALAIAKAVLVTALAGLFLCFRRRGTRAGMSALAAGAAVLALGPWLLLQPVLASLLGTVLTLYLLERPALVADSRVPRCGMASRPCHNRARWLLVPLFALWANLDDGFVLGPILVGLYALGEAARGRQGADAPRSPGELRSLTLLAAAGAAACFLTPFHYHILTWPVPLGLSPAERAWMGDPLGQGLVVSPFAGRLTAAPAFSGVGGWAYCLLLAAGAASFVLCGQVRPLGRLLVWLALAALSAYQARAIPFFAVAAGPILALNLQEWSGAAAVTERRRRLAAVLRGAGAPAGLALLVAAWPGWLQPAPYRPRGWAVEPDETLVRLARRIDQRHSELSFRSDRVALTFSPEVAHYLAWFCPSEKGFVDSRWPLFAGTADDFVRMRRYLLRPEGSGPDAQLGPLLDANRIDRVLLYDPDAGRTLQAFRCLLRGEPDWELLEVQGAAALFGRRSGAESASAWKPLDLRRAAYHPEPDRQAPQTAPPAPQPPGPFDAFWRARNDHSADRGEAALYLNVFDLKAEQRRRELGTQWLLALATGLIGTGPGSEPAGAAGAVALRLHLTPLPPDGQGAGGQPAAEAFAAGFAAAQDSGPPEALLLAVRAARRALAANPEDAGAFLLLGEAYLRLAGQTREQSWRAVLPPLAADRHAQALAALEQAVGLRPDLDRAHALLVQLYYEDHQLDRALDHLRARLRIAEEEAAAHGPEAGTAAVAAGSGDHAATAAATTQALRADVGTMESLVRQAEKIYEGNATDKNDPLKVFERAALAERHGLTRKALDMLLESHPAIFGQSGTELELELMLRAGRASEVRGWLEPKHEAALGFSHYHSLQAEAAAACGDYAGADAELGALSERVRKVGLSAEQLAPVRGAVALRVGDAVLARPSPAAGPAGLAGAAFRQFDALRPLGGPADLLRQEADIRVLRGLLAVESGAVDAARAHFHAALDVWGDEVQAATGAGLDFPTRPIAQLEIRLLEASGGD